MKVARKIWTTCCLSILLLLVLLTFGGCSNKTASNEDVKRLIASDSWYRYDEVTGESEKLIFRDDDTSTELQVLDYSDYHLLLEIDGEIKDYTNVDIDFEITDGEKYLSGYSMAASILSGNEEEVVLTHYNYDGDVEYPDNVCKTYPIADDAEFYDLQVETHTKDDVEIKNDTIYQKLTGADAASMMEWSSGFVWFNAEMEVSKIVFYGATYVEE